MRDVTRIAAGALAFAVTATTAFAQQGDWPQFGGPARNFTVEGPALADAWPAEGPKPLWKRELGEGYAGIAIDGTRLYTMLQRGSQELITALDAATGATLWEHAYEAPITSKMSRAPGPRSTPLVLDDVLITAGATGQLRAVDKATGALVWSHDLYAAFQGHVQDEYYAASPLLYRETVIVPVGGPGQSVMAFHRKTGAVVWKAHDFKISYASPILIDVDGQEQAVLVMESDVIGIDPRNGALLWQHPHANNTRTNVSTPVWGPGNLLFVSSAYSSVGRVLRLARAGNATSVTELWNSRDLRVHVANAVRLGDTIYGSSGDFGPSFFRALDIHTGTVLWEQRDVGKASFVAAGGYFVMLNEDGEAILAWPEATGLRILSRVPVLTKTAWTPPSLASGILYVRDRSHIAAFDLREASGIRDASTRPR